MYKLLRAVFFLFPAEGVHYFAMNGLKLLCGIPLFKKILSRCFTPANRITECFGLKFKTPIGLAAGFDKNARYLNELEALGFGFVEIGTVTPKPQDGNDKPRLFRLPKDKALINRMGFNNDGAQTITERLKKWKEREYKAQQTEYSIQKSEAGNRQPATGEQAATSARLIIGGNIGKNKVTANEDAWKDYEICFRALFDYVDYFVVNVSSPNTPGLRELQEKDSLRKILSHLQTINAQQQTPKPLLLKIAPDLTTEQIDDVIDLAMEIKLDGLVAANTTINRRGLATTEAELAAIGAGGLSGLPVRERSTEIVRYIQQRSVNAIPVIASGGIFTAADAKEKFNAGASLVQVWTGFIYEGPGIVKKISS